MQQLHMPQLNSVEKMICESEMNLNSAIAKWKRVESEKFTFIYFFCSLNQIPGTLAAGSVIGNWAKNGIWGWNAAIFFSMLLKFLFQS